jgi:hypothetical protein
MTPTADQIVVLTSTLQKLATKRVVASRNGPPVIEDYPRGSTHFRFEEWPVASFDEMAAALATLQTQAYSFVVRGRILEGTERQRAQQRLLHARRGKNGNLVLATLAAQARRWIAIDLDSIPCPTGIDPLYDVDAVVEYVISLLPDAFHGASCFWYFTGSHGIKPGIRLRLWFWADRPLEDWELKVWLRDSPVDLSLYSPAQPIYVARPIFVGMPDPVPHRYGIWPGYSDTVEVPAIEKLQARAASSSSTPGSGGGYDVYREQIGDHAGGRGFHGPLKNAIGAYFGAHGGGADVEWLRADLEAAIRAAEHNRGAGYVERRVADLDPWIAWTREREQERADVKSRPIEPTYPAPMGSVEEARAVLAANVREFANEARSYWSCSNQ